MLCNNEDRKSPVILTKALAILLTAITAVCCILVWYSVNLQDKLEEALSNELTESEICEVMTENESKTLSDGNVYYSREHIKEMADELYSLTETMSALYPDYFVYYDQENIVYLPISENLKKHTYDTSLITEDPETGEMSYSDGNGTTSLKGIDVSEWQDDIDWEKVKADGVEFAFVRAGTRGYSTGNLFEDESAKQNLEAANLAGVPVGVYFYSCAVNAAEGVEEAEFVLSIIDGYDVSWPVVIDVEMPSDDDTRLKDITAAQRTDAVVAFCEKIKEAGYTPMIYANMHTFGERLDLTRLEEYEKWFAQYFSKPYYPYEYGIWQYTSSGEVAGIDGSVDMNISFKDYGKGN